MIKWYLHWKKVVIVVQKVLMKIKTQSETSSISVKMTQIIRVKLIMWFAKTINWLQVFTDNIRNKHCKLYPWVFYDHICFHFNNHDMCTIFRTNESNERNVCLLNFENCNIISMFHVFRIILNIKA